MSSNPFSRPSPFVFSNASKESFSYSPYSNENNRITESQVKPGFSGLSSPYLAPTTNSYSSYMNRYEDNQYLNSNPFANSTSRTLTPSPLPYDPMFSGRNEFSNSSISQNQSYSQNYYEGSKENPFHRPSLFGGSNNNSLNLRDELNIREPTNRNLTSDYENNFTTPTNYDHLVYKPNSNTQVSKNSVPFYSSLAEELKHSPHKYNTNNYRTYNSDPVSITSYNNNTNDLINESFISGVNKDVDLFEHKPIKDYSHLEYKGNKQETTSTLPHSNGFDKSKYYYEREKSKSNDVQLQYKDFNNYQINNEEQEQSKIPFYEIPKQNEFNNQLNHKNHHYDTEISNHYETKGNSYKMEYDNIAENRRENSNKGSLEKRNEEKRKSIEKEQYEKPKKYEFEDFNEDEEYEQSKYTQNYETNINKPKLRSESIEKYQPENKYKPVEKYELAKSYEPVNNYNRFEDFDEDKEFNFNNGESFNEEYSEVEPHFNKNFNQNQPEKYTIPQKHTSQSIANDYIPERIKERENDMIERFGNDDSHYVNDYSISNKRETESKPVNDSKLKSGNERYPSVINLDGIEFYSVMLVNN